MYLARICICDDCDDEEIKMSQNHQKKKKYVWYDKDDVVEWRRRRYDVKLSSMCCKNFYRFFSCISLCVCVCVWGEDCQIDAKKMFYPALCR